MSQNLEIVRHFYEDSSAEFTNTECSKGEILQELCMIRPVDNAEKYEHNYDHEGNIQASWLSASEETGSMSDQTVHENRPISFITSNQVNLNNLSLPLVISNTNCVRSETDAFNNDNKVKSIANSSANSTDLSSEVLWNISTSDGSMSDISTESNPISEGKELENIEEQFVITGKDKTTDMDNSFLLEKYKNEALELRNSLERLNLERARLEVEASHSACLSQIEQQRREIELFKQERELDKRTQTTMKLEMDTFKKQYESANKEKEATVMRYAVSEMEVINQRKERENAEKKFKETLKEKEGLTLKLKNAMIDKARVSLLLDNKCSELANAQKDVEKLKEELNSKDIKIKWTQNKLKTEMDCYKESQSQVEKLSSKIQEAKEEVERAKKDADSAIKQFQFSQENKAYVLEQQLKELQAQLIMERHNLKDTDHNNKQLMHEVDALRNKHLLLIDEDNALKLKVSSLEKEKQDNEQLISRLRESMEKSSLEVDQLQEKTCNLDNLKLQLQQERDKVAQLQTEIAQLRTSNEELVNDMVSCREREAEMLEFTQKVTAKNVRLQSEYSCIEAKTRQLEFAEEPLQKKIDELSKELEKLRNELKKEQSDRTDEKKIVARHLAEKTATIEKLTKEIEDLKGENQVMKHKHSATLRELNREMLQCRKRLEQFENSSGSESLCHGSRASSYNSLNESSPTSVNSHGNIQFEPDKQAMVDRILRLQRENNRLREKIDFLEEHCKQLIMEMQKKTRVLQGYILREEAGTLSSGSMDSNKAEFAKYGGIMASVYGSKAVDDTMTLELSLEINHKLQAVLEDTLLKNITLKENIDTLGDEIRRLSRKS